MVTVTPKAPYHSMYLGYPSFDAVSMKAKSMARFSAATITITTLMPMPRADGWFQKAMFAPKIEAIQAAMYMRKMPRVAAMTTATYFLVTLMMRVA